MIIDRIFREFISVVRENKRYTIGLLSDEGVVTSCSDESQIGRKLDLTWQDEHNIYYPVVVKQQNFGYLWINGSDENLEMMSSLIRESLVVRLTYEITENNLRQNFTQDDRLIKLILDEKEFDMDQILDLAHEMNLDRNKTRVAILLYDEKGFDEKRTMKMKLMPGGNESIVSLLDRTTVLCFKNVPADLPEEELKACVMKFLKTMKDLDIGGTACYVGSLQKKFKNYKSSYQHCLWLRENVPVKKEQIVFLSDYLYEFYFSRVPLQDVSNVYDYYKDCSKGIDIDELVRICDSLTQNNFNISQTAEELFLHKNTLVYKLKKYEDTFHIDIRGDFKGRVLFVLISSSLREYQKRRQVGEEL